MRRPEKPKRNLQARLSEQRSTQRLANCAATTAARWPQWQWGRAHAAYFPNAVFERVPLLRDWLRVTVPTPGGYDTVNRGPSMIRDDEHPYEQRFGAGLRIITDMAAPEDSRMMIAPGQSGNPLSSHYADLLARWRAVDWLHPAHAAAVDTLTLAPAP